MHTLANSLGQDSEYKSAEEILLGPACIAGKYLFRGVCSSLKAPFVLPSMIRKLRRGQTWIQREGWAGKEKREGRRTCDYDTLALTIGTSVPLFFTGVYFLNEFQKGNSVPAVCLAVLLTFSNFASGTFEYNRREKNKRELLELRKSD